MASRRKPPALPPQKPKPAGWLLDRTIEQAVYLERLKSGEVRGLAGPIGAAETQIQSIIRDLIARVANTPRPWESADYAQAISRVASELRQAAQQVGSQGSELIQKAATLEADLQGVILAQSLPVRYDFARVPVAQLEALTRAPIEGRTLADWTRGLEQTSLSNITQIVNRGLRDGTGIREMAAQVRGATLKTSSAAEAIVRTAVTHASAGARDEFAQANTDVIVGVRWVSVLDSRTTVICAGLDGQVFKVDEGPRPPAHVNCRSTTQLLLRSPEELVNGTRKRVDQGYLEDAGARAARGTRPSIDEGAGKVKELRGSTSYRSWLRSQPATVQDRVLGDVRGRLFRSGRLSIEQFVGADHLPMTLEELRQRWGLTLAEIGQ